jgi:hypothetical protein
MKSMLMSFHTTFGFGKGCNKHFNDKMKFLQKFWNLRDNKYLTSNEVGEYIDEIKRRVCCDKFWIIFPP